jgi:RimJ/RimL family protein N-acetyltransferase
MSSSVQTTVSIPILETDRLRLRPHRATDLDACAAIWGDPLVTRFLGGRPLLREEVWARILRYAGHWLWFSYGFWALEEKGSGALIGELGFADFQRGLQPSLDGIPEIGWILATAAHGKGYATEAVQAATQWADAHLTADCTACIVDPGNTASLRVAEKCGYREVTRTTYKGQPTILHERKQPQS